MKVISFALPFLAHVVYLCTRPPDLGGRKGNLSSFFLLFFFQEDSKRKIRKLIISTPSTVSWNWGSGHPSGTVAEIKAQGSLEITSKGKKVHKNANTENPAVHVEREGNDVVKRASELTKESTTASTPHPKLTAEAEAEGEGEDKKAAEIGEKRERTESAIPAAEKELTEAEKDSGKETKKPKLTEEISKGAQENGSSNGAEREAESSSPPKKRGPGRPKKSDKEAKKRDEATKLEASETISGRTRSKAS